MSDPNLKRRSLLRNMFVAGCALCAPVAWGAGAAPGKARQLGEAKSSKVSKAQAKYRDTPNGKQKCAVCSNFVAPNACNLVEGKISPSGWCTLFTPKTA